MAKALQSLASLVDRSVSASIVLPLPENRITDTLTLIHRSLQAMVNSILPCLNELKNDKDPDVEYFAKEALRAIRGKRKISPC